MKVCPRGLAIAIVSAIAVVTTLGCENSKESPIEPPPQANPEQSAATSAELDWQEELFTVFSELRVIRGQINDCFLATRRQHAAKQYQAASEEVEAMAGKLQPLMEEISGKLKSLSQGLEAQGPENVENGELLTSAEQQFADAQRRIGELQSLAVQLAETAEDVKDLGRQDEALELVAAAGEAEGQGRIDEAIKLYEAALKSWPDAAHIRQRVDQLKQTWTIKSEEHAQARQFVYNTWTDAEPGELPTLLPQARAALATLKQVDDYLTARTLLLAADAHLSQLTLAAGVASAEAGQPAVVPDQLTADVARLVLEISDYLAVRRQPPDN